MGRCCECGVIGAYILIVVCVLVRQRVLVWAFLVGMPIGVGFSITGERVFFIFWWVGGVWICFSGDLYFVAGCLCSVVGVC
jgi:hypothetical protein